MEKLKEKLASYEHDRWIRWQKYLHECCIKKEDGTLTIPKEKVKRWDRLIETEYENLTEQEKETARLEADHILNILKEERKEKVITLCGSLRFKETFMKVAEELEFLGNCVLTVIYPTKEDKDAYTEKEAKMMDRMHKARIRMSDAIYVINKDGYIGTSTKSEIEYAKKLGLEIMYYQERED